ncbi:uncharacterized protein LOC113450613 [Pseudonaja textilis]|uniref:uncharacterized protein LOC113450613 n=1 Tax=Pseudonaja textilis TaxID=8673 RepID=UPI000EA94D6F|nr:uncharacterized protein LOC113450613 [Pseudonaja textilis]
MALSRPPGGQRLSHLRSIGSWAPVPGVSPVIHFSKAVTLFGRNTRVVDCHLNLPATDLSYISRIHARIIRTDGEYILVDSSLTGVYVNDIRIQGRVNLREGDTVTFGHPDGTNILLGSYTRQPNSPFYFLFEHCDCSPGQMRSVYADGRDFPQPLKGPDLVSAGVSPPGNPNLALAGNVSPPQMALAGVLPGRAPLVNSTTQHGPQDAPAPPPSPALSSSSPRTSEKASEKSSFPSSPCPPLSAPSRRASQVLRSASPDYILPDENSFAATGSPPPQESPESGDSVSLCSSESTVECDTPPPQGWPPHEAAGSDPEGGCVPPLLPGPTCSEASEAADRDGSPKAAEASGPWEETLQLTPVFPTETEGESGCAQSVSGPESPALSEAGEEQTQVDLCPSMEETACLGESFASEPESPVEEMEVAELAGSRAQVRRGSVEEREENLMEKHPAEAEGAESGPVGPSAESQVSEVGHIQQHDSAKRTAEIHFPPGEEPMSDSSTQILSQETLDSERRSPLLPSRHSSRGGVDPAVASPQKAAASEAVEMEPPTGEALEGPDGHLGGRELEPAMGSAIPAEAEGVCEKASMGDLCAEMGRQTDGEMEVAAAESFKALGASQEPGAEGADSKAWEARAMLVQKQPETPVLGEQSKGRFYQGDKPKDWRGASDTADGNLHSKDLPEPREGAGGGALGTELLQARPLVVSGNKVLAGASETSAPEPPENLGEVVSEQGLFQSTRILFEDQAGEGSVMEGKREPETPRSAESSNNSSEVAADSRLQDGAEASGSHDPSLGVTGVPVVGLSGGGPPGYKSGSERRLQGDSKDPPREEESEWRRSTVSTSAAAAAAANEDAAEQHREAEGGLEKDPTCLVGQEGAEGSSAAAAADASLARSPSPEQSFWGSAGRKGDSSGGGLEEGRIPHLGDCSLAGTQLPSSNSQHEAAERSVSESSHLSSCQYVTKDERFTGLSEEGRVKTIMGEEEEEEEGEASPVANAPSAVTKRGLDPSPRQVGALSGPCSAFSSGSSCVMNQRLVKADLQELKPDTVEPERLETCLEGASQGADDVGGTLLRLEDPLIRDRASEEPEAPVERISLPVPGEPGPDVLLPEERGGSAQIAEAGGSPGLPLPGLGLLQPGDVAVNLPVEPTDDSDGDNGLRGQVPAPEAEKGEPAQFGPSKTGDLHGGRDASPFDPAEQAANATESREAFREPTEESATGRPADLAVPETRAGPPKGAEMSPEGQPSSRCDQGSPGKGAASSTTGTEAEEPPRSGKSRKRASEAPVGAGGEEMEPDPVHLAGQPEKPPLDSASEPAEDGRVAWKGFPEEASRDLVQGSRPVAGRLPGPPGTVTVASPLGEAVKGPLAREASSSPQSGKGGYAQKARMVPEDANRLLAPESACRLGKDPEASAGHRGGFGCSEPCEEEKPNRSPPRKRPPNGDLDWEGAACHPKKLCREDFASVRGPGSDPAAPPVAPPPPHLKESVEQFGKTIENFLDQCRNRVPLCSDPTERSGEALARIVRNYFKSNIDSHAPERAGAAEEAPPSETAAAKGIDGQAEGRGAGGPRESPGGDGPGSPKGEEAEAAHISEGAPVSPGGRPAASGSSTKEEESKGSGAPGQEGFYYFEEEPFSMEVGSALGDAGSSSPAESPHAALGEGPWEEEWDTPSSLDITASSQSYEPSPSPHWSNLDQALDSCSEGSGSLSEADWYYGSDEHPEILLDVAVPWPEDSPAAARDPRPEFSPLEQEAPGNRLQRGDPGGGSGPGGSACQEDPGSPPEKAAEASRRGVPAQGSPGGSPDPGRMESAPREPSPPPSPGGSSSKTFLQPSVGRWDPPLKTEPSDGEPDDQDCRQKEPPPPSGRAPGASALAGGSPGEGPSCPPPGPAPAEGSTGPLVKEEPMQEDEPPPPLPPVGAASSPLSPLCPSQAGERGSPPGKDLCGPELPGVGQAGPHQASQEAPGIPGTSGCFPGDPGARGAMPWRGDGSPLARSPLADPGLRSQGFQEAKKQPWPPLSYPASSSPLPPSVCRHSHDPKTSADEQPEGPWPPADFGGREPGAPCQSEEAGLGEPSDAECLHVAAAFSSPAPPEAEERAPLPRDPPAQTESHSRCLRGRAEGRSLAEWASSEQDVAFQLQECQSVLAEILQALTAVEGLDQAHVEKWRDQIAALQTATKMPQTHIAVVGNTGAGKSCLLNALLDEEAMLPTSAMRACTAVVVEISRAAGGSPYEAEVEFLSREEWEQELAALLEDMKDKAGILRKRCPDRKTEAGAAYSRVKAVYGRVDELDKLEDPLGVTQHLGTVKHISAETAADFRVEIEKFIDSRTDNLREMKGGEFWPIVKCVRIRVATAEVLRTGAVLVDLPGTRDSNAARDTMAREYLKDCSAVWVTASITRAVDDKTAKELLSANFRRQLFMDGLYGSLAFVCTKTDSFSISDIIRDLHLQDQIRPLEEELQELEHQRTQAEAEKKHLYGQLQPQQPVRKESAAAESVCLQRHDILEKEFQISSLQREKEARLRAISLICVQARNEFSKQRILMDFSAGLQEVSRRAEGEEDGEEDGDEGDSAGEQQPVNLEVFTVSSTEYLKLGGKLLCNGQPQVFHDIKDTEIPALKKFAMDTALKHSMVATEKVIRDVARVLSQMVNYLNSQRTEADAHQAQVQEMLQQALQGLPALLQGVLRASAQDVRRAFETLLGSLQNGAERAKQLSEAIAKGWGSPVVGYPHGAYRAICNHRGVYTSPKYQSVDFNKELAEPILQVIYVAWNEVFSSWLTSCIEGFTAALLDQLSSFFRGLKKQLHQHRPVAEALRAIHAQQMEAARARLLNFTLDQMNSITRKQRTVSRLLIPTVQAAMEPAYAACSQLSGRGYFQRMKEQMETFVHLQKDAIFDSAVEKMWRQLELFQLSIHHSLQSVAQDLATSIQMQFEPLLRPVQKNKGILPELQRLCAKVDKICQRSGVDYVLPTALQPEEQPPKTEAKLPGSGDCISFPAASMDVRVGALPLPHLAAIQVSREHITLTLAGEPTQASLPLGSVYRCEVCLPLGCLFLHVSAKAAWEVGVQCRVRLPSPGLGSQEALVIREATQDERQLPQLWDCLAARLSAATRVQELSPQQGREKLLSLGVPYLGQQSLESADPAGPQGSSAPEPVAAVGTAGQQPRPLLLPWHPHGRKRAGEAVLPQLEKKSKVLPGEPAGYAWLPCSQSAGVKPTSYSAALLGSHSPEGAFRPGSPPCPMAETPGGEPLAVPCAAGLLWAGAHQGGCRKPPSVTVKEEEADLPPEKTRPRLL